MVLIVIPARLIAVLALAALKVAVFPVPGTGDALQFPVVAHSPLEEPFQVALAACAWETINSDRASEWTNGFRRSFIGGRGGENLLGRD